MSNKLIINKNFTAITPNLQLAKNLTDIMLKQKTLDKENNSSSSSSSSILINFLGKKEKAENSNKIIYLNDYITILNKKASKYFHEIYNLADIHENIRSLINKSKNFNKNIEIIKLNSPFNKLHKLEQNFFNLFEYYENQLKHNIDNSDLQIKIISALIQEFNTLLNTGNKIYESNNKALKSIIHLLIKPQITKINNINIPNKNVGNLNINNKIPLPLNKDINFNNIKTTLFNNTNNNLLKKLKTNENSNNNTINNIKKHFVGVMNNNDFNLKDINNNLMNIIPNINIKNNLKNRIQKPNSLNTNSNKFASINKNSKNSKMMDIINSLINKMEKIEEKQNYLSKYLNNSLLNNLTNLFNNASHISITHEEQMNHTTSTNNSIYAMGKNNDTINIKDLNKILNEEALKLNNTITNRLNKSNKNDGEELNSNGKDKMKKETITAMLNKIPISRLKLNRKNTKTYKKKKIIKIKKKKIKTNE
jgi:hypothetical protein